MKTEDHNTLWELTRGQRARYGLAMLAMASGQLLLFGVPLVVQAAIDGLMGPAGAHGAAKASSTWLAEVAAPFGGGALTVLLVGAGAILLLTAVGGLFHYLRGRWTAIACENVVRRLRGELYRHLGRLPQAYHDRVDTGDTVQRCTSDVETVRVFLGTQIVEMGRSVLMLMLVAPILVWLDLRLALVSLALYPVIIGFAVTFFVRIKRVFQRMDEAEGRMTSVLQENLTGVRVVRAFARQEYEESKFGVANAEFRDRSADMIRMLGVFWGSIEFLCKAQVGLLLIVGAHAAVAGSVSVGVLAAFMFYESMLLFPISRLGRVIAEAGKAFVALRRLREILREPPESDHELRLARPRRGRRALRGAIEFAGLTFGYDPEEPVLQDVSFSVQPGETLGILGAPGSGKSTLVRLLLRLYDYAPRSGSIRLDGFELRGLSRSFVRSEIGVVLQDPFLYSKTVAENLRVGAGRASSKELEHAARAAAVHASIAEFEDGYETLVGERGVTLSGGQRQRLALARALLKDPAILILDDALSAVDTRTEAEILSALEARRGRSTTIVIAHRLSSLQHADRILVLEQGRIVQAGAHDELMREEGPYRRLWRIQGAVEAELDGDWAGDRRVALSGVRP